MMSSAYRCVVAAVVVTSAAAQYAKAQSCNADITGDRVVNGTDLAQVLAQWGPCGAGGCPADIDGDGAVEGKDLAFVLSGWGPCPVVVPSWATLIEAAPDPAVVHNATLRAAITATGYAWRVLDPATQIEMVLIPPGTFPMGCSASAQYPCLSFESPVHQVTLTQPFYIGRYEVTQAQWTARMGSNPSRFRAPSAEVPANQVPNRPVEKLSWNMTQSFLAGTGMRLPSEAEWEYAYRAGTTTAFHSMPGYPNGTNDDSLATSIAWFRSSEAGWQTRPVGQLASNGFGIHDMAGNVWEWVNDWYGNYQSSSQIDPTGPGTGSLRVFRGGWWSYLTDGVRSSHRYYSQPASVPDDTGFRVARDP